MPYIGSEPSSGFITTAKQRITSSTNNYVDLDNSISSLADVIVWVNSVKQDSTNLTLTTSTRITLGGTLTASDVVEIAYLGKAVATQTPDTGTVTNDMLAGSIANSKLANSSITLNGSAVSLGGSATVGGDNTPSFGAKLSSNQSLSTSTQTKMQLATELWDTDSAFDSSTNYRFTVPSGEAGKYMFIGSGNIGAISDGGDIRMTFYKNGSSSNQGNIRYFAGGAGVGIYFTSSAIIDLAVGDYIELYQFASSGNHFDAGMTYLYGFKLLGV